MVGRNFLDHAGTRQWDLLAPTRRELDLLDARAVTDYLKRHQTDLIVHAAGVVGGIQANIREPVRFLLGNLDMGRNVVWAAYEAGVRRLLNLGSSCMYPRNAKNPLSEDMILQGELEPTNEGYALAKLTVSRLCEYITTQYPAFAYKTIIPCNLYGRYDRFLPESSHLVAAVIHKLHEAKILGHQTVDIWGDGTARREFMYAGDLADFLVEAVNRFDTLPCRMNVGVGHDHAVSDYYRVAAEIVQWGGTFSYDLTRPVGMRQKLLSIEKQIAWGWRPAISLREGIKNTYEFYLARTSQHGG